MSNRDKWREAPALGELKVTSANGLHNQQLAGDELRDSVEKVAKHQVYFDSANEQLLNTGQDLSKLERVKWTDQTDLDDDQEEEEQNERHRLISSDGRRFDSLREKKPLVEWDCQQGNKFHHHQDQLKRMNSFTWAQYKWRPNFKFVLLAVLLVGICGILFILSTLVREVRNETNVTRQQVVGQLTKQLDDKHRKQLENEQRTRWLVSTPKCHIPILEPWDKSIGSFVKRKEPVNCMALLDDIISGRSKSGAKNWTDLLPVSMSYVQSNRLYFTERAIMMGALSRPLMTGQCCFKRLVRKVESDDELEPASSCDPIYEQGLQVNSSLIEVICGAWKYSNVHAFFVPNEDEQRALAKVGAQRLSPDGDFYSVLMVGVDTISRLNGLRQLNKTLNTLKELYGALEFVGYNKVGENTFPNLIPLLTGLTPNQLTQVQCWEAKDYDKNESGDQYLDNCKFLWNYYQQIGYLTYFGEDWPQASTFNYLKPGFKYEPTHFYGRPFTLARDHLIFPRWDGPGCASCQLDRPLVEVDIGNLKTFIESNANKLPYFAMHWFNCPQHDDLNGASQVDHIFNQFFQDIRQRLESDRTFVVFFSDHGYRWNDFVSTRVGHYESSLPLMTIAPPKAFIERHPDLYEHLKLHQNALLTPFDIFKTLIDLKDLSSGQFKSRQRRQAFKMDTLKSDQSTQNEVETLNESSLPISGSTTSETKIEQLKPVDGTSFKQKFSTLSLFDNNTLAQLDRSCIDAGIPDNYCVCHQFEPIAADGDDVLGAAYYLVYVHLESRLRDHLDLCHTLELGRIHHAELFDLTTTPNTKTKTRRRKKSSRAKVVSLDESDKRTRGQLTSAKPARHLHGASDDQNRHDYLPEREYNLMVSTEPGGGLFQEVVRYYGTSMADCKLEIAKTRKVIEDKWAKIEDRRESVLTMNDVCDFSVHSESLSRFNLYRDQSKCVKSNIELKKICYCRDLES